MSWRNGAIAVVWRLRDQARALLTQTLCTFRLFSISNIVEVENVPQT